MSPRATTCRRSGRGLAALALACAAALLLPGEAAPAAGVAETRAAPADSLAAAVAAARPGGEVVLPGGVYAERLVLRKAVTLRAAPGEAVVIDGGGRGRVVEIHAPGVTLEGLTLRHSGDRVGDTDACVYVHESAAGTRLRGSRLEACAFGVWVNGAADVRLEDNAISGYRRPIVSDMGNGINLWRVTGALVRGNRIRSVRDGIYVSVSTASTLAGNTLRDLRFGIHYMYSDRMRVVDNVTCDSRVGMALMFSKQLEVAGNRAWNNAEHGILFRSLYDSRIAGNTVAGNGKGFFLNDAHGNAIAGNQVSGNAIGVHLTAGSDDNRVWGNNFAANRTQVRFAWRYPIAWHEAGRGNYWSDYLGWDLDRDGVGDRPYHASNRMDALVFRYPQLRLLARSPVVLLLQALEARFPVLRPPSIVDRHPALHPFPRPGAAEGGAASHTAAADCPAAPGAASQPEDARSAS